MTAKLYKVGDKVRIKTEAELLASGWECRAGVFRHGDSHIAHCQLRDGPTSELLGTIQIIKEKWNWTYEAGDYCFTDEMIAGLAEEPKVPKVPKVPTIDDQTWSKEAEMFSEPMTGTAVLITNGTTDGPPIPLSELQRPGNKYIRTIHDVHFPIQSCLVDVYEVLEAFAVACPARQHAIKKLLCFWHQG